jgi:hypothetical protein
MFGVRRNEDAAGTSFQISPSVVFFEDRSAVSTTRAVLRMEVPFNHDNISWRGSLCCILETRISYAALSRQLVQNTENLIISSLLAARMVATIGELFAFYMRCFEHAALPICAILDRSTNLSSRLGGIQSATLAMSWCTSNGHSHEHPSFDNRSAQVDSKEHDDAEYCAAKFGGR